LNVLQGHSMRRRPDRDRASDAFRIVVAHDPIGAASRRDELREHRGYGAARERRKHRHRQRLVPAVTDHVE
jgi:hypothetical protein